MKLSHPHTVKSSTSLVPSSEKDISHQEASVSLSSFVPVIFLRFAWYTHFTLQSHNLSASHSMSNAFVCVCVCVCVCARSSLATNPSPPLPLSLPIDNVILHHHFNPYKSLPSESSPETHPASYAPSPPSSPASPHSHSSPLHCSAPGSASRPYSADPWRY